MTAAGWAGWAGWLVEALVASTLLMGLVLVARGAMRRAFGPQLGYAMWALPVLRLMLPPLPAGWHDAAVLPIGRASAAVTVLIVPATAATSVPVAATPVTAVAAMPWGMMLAVAWAIGAIGFFGVHLWRHRRFCARLLGDARMLNEVRGVRVIETPAASGPLAFGIARRFVAFPRDFAERYDADERELALAHELGHHARGDLIANWVALGVLALHWFNPVAWRAFRAFRCDQELANDARVLAGRSRMDRHIYACAIVKAAHGGAVSAACHLHTIADLKGRLRMLTNDRVSRTRLMTGGVAVLGLVGVGLFTTASGTRAAAAVTGRIEAATGVTLHVPPVPAVPPAGTATKRIVIVRDGKTRVYEGAAADRYAAANRMPVPPVPPVPAAAVVPAAPAALPAPAVPSVPSVPSVPTVNIISGDCGPDHGARDYVVTRRKDGGDQTVICTDRIAAAAMAGRMSEADQHDIQRKAMTAALASLHTTRASMAASPGLPAEARSDAVKEIDASIRELEAEIADIGKD